jgi:hypothetical protein
MQKPLFFIALSLLLSACENGNVSDAKSAVKDRLKDPGSAEFRNIKFNESGAVCGQFNAKNSFGGYTGFKQFAYKNGKLFLGGDERPPADEPDKVAWLDQRIVELESVLAICRELGVQ